MSTDNDLVVRLRIRWDAMGDMANDERAAAATEIERLRKERDEASQRVCSIAYPEQHIQELVKTINTLRVERDEARREVCELDAELPEERLVVWNAARLPNDLAAKRGWDCFDRSKYAKRRKPIAK